MTTVEKKYPEGTTKEQWDEYEIDKAKHDERVNNSKPKEPNAKLFLELESFQIAMEHYRQAYSEWDMMRSMDAPNKPGYYRANND